MGGRLLPRNMVPSRPGDKLHKLAFALDVDGPDDVYPALVGISDGSLGLGAAAPTSARSRASTASTPAPSSGRCSSTRCTYLPDDILTKVDRATMAASLEARVRCSTRACSRRPGGCRRPSACRGRTGKVALTEVLARHVPPALTAGPKTGFGVPVGDWLRGPLAGWAADLLDPVRLRGEGFLDAGAVDGAWREHRDGTRDHAHALWAVLMFEAWLESVSAA